MSFDLQTASLLLPSSLTIKVINIIALIYIVFTVVTFYRRTKLLWISTQQHTNIESRSTGN